MDNSRIHSAKILQRILEEKIFFSELKKQISEKDLSFINMLILTTLRHLCGIEKILNPMFKKKIPHKHRIAQYLLMLAITELFYMETAPYAVINETVNNVKRLCDKFLAGMVNAVLHRVLEQKIELKKIVDEYLPIPQNFMPILDGYSDDIINKIGQSVRLVPSLDITVKQNPLIWQKKLSAHLLPNGSLRMCGNPKVTHLPEYDKGQWWVQDVASSLPVLAMNAIDGADIIDLCAAPGGKTAQMASEGAHVTALDISETRLQILKENMARLGFSDIHTICDDALHFMQIATKKYDFVLLDAPCSATGTFRRHPEVLHIKNIEDVQIQANIQKQLLFSCKNILKVGGILIYSVCSISKIEGELQIQEFLQENPSYKKIPILPQDISRFGTWSDNLILSDGTIRTLPFYEKSLNGMDSFFICKMQRII